MPRIAIIDYGSGNLRSAAKALAHVVEGKGDIVITSDPADLRAATHIVLPGVGAFGDCITGLSAIAGMRETLEEEVRGKKKWFLGICVGMQMLLERGHEHGMHEGLGWIEGEVVKLGASNEARGARDDASLLATRSSSLKIPHMGWNDLSIRQHHPLLAGIENGMHAYFVHSYHAAVRNADDIPATVEYGGPVAAVLARDNMMGTQFHPEKSQETGLRLLRNFVEM